MDAKTELEKLRRLKALEDKVAQTPPEGVGAEALDWGKTALRGLGLGAKFLLENGPLGARGQVALENLPSDIAVEEKARRENAPSAKFGRWLDEKLPPKPGIGRAAVEGMGAGLATSPKYLMANVLAGGAGSGAAEATNKALETQNPLLRQMAAAVAGMVAGGGTGFALGPRSPETTISKAERDTGVFNQIALERIGPPRDVADTANRTADAANSVIKSVKRVRGETFEDLLAGQTIRGFDAAKIHSSLKTMARNQTSPELGAAYDAVADSMVAQGGNKFITDVKTLGGQFKRFKENPLGENASTAKKYAAGDISQAVQDAENLLGLAAPRYKEANERFAGYTQDVVRPLQEGSIGRIADRNPNLPAPTPVGRLENIVNDQSPQGIRQTLDVLRASGASPQQIARALFERRLNDGKLFPNQTAFGGPGSGQEAQMAALLDSAGVAKKAVQAPLEAADSLASAAKIGPGTAEAATIRAIPPGLSVRVLQRLGFSGGDAKAAAAEKIAEVLRSAGPKEIEQLLKLSMFDSKLRMALTLSGAIRPEMLQQQGGQ